MYYQDVLNGNMVAWGGWIKLDYLKKLKKDFNCFINILCLLFAFSVTLISYMFQSKNYLALV